MPVHGHLRQNAGHALPVPQRSPHAPKSKTPGIRCFEMFPQLRGDWAVTLIRRDRQQAGEHAVSCLHGYCKVKLTIQLHRLSPLSHILPHGIEKVANGFQALRSCGHRPEPRSRFPSWHAPPSVRRGFPPWNRRRAPLGTGTDIDARAHADFDRTFYLHAIRASRSEGP